MAKKRRPTKVGESAWDKATAVEALTACEQNVDALKRLLLQLLAGTAADPDFSVAFASAVKRMDADRKVVRQHLAELEDLKRDGSSACHTVLLGRGRLARTTVAADA